MMSKSQPSYLKIRLHLEDEPRDLTWTELESEIAAGKLGPDVLFWNEVASQGQWWTLGNLGLFHARSPKTYPMGEHLKELRRKYRERCEKDYARSKERMATHRCVQPYVERAWLVTRSSIEEIESTEGYEPAIVSRSDWTRMKSGLKEGEELWWYRNSGEPGDASVFWARLHLPVPLSGIAVVRNGSIIDALVIAWQS